MKWLKYFIDEEDSENSYDSTKIHSDSDYAKFCKNIYLPQSFAQPEEYEVLKAEVEFRIQYMDTDLSGNPSFLELIFGKKKQKEIEIGTVPPEFYTEVGSQFLQRTKKRYTVTDYFGETGKLDFLSFG